MMLATSMVRGTHTIRRLLPSLALAGATFALVACGAATTAEPTAKRVAGCELKPETQCAGTSFSLADLSGADLSGADLSGANFYKANLTGTNLSKANLSGAKFA